MNHATKQFSAPRLSLLCKELGTLFRSGISLADAFFLMEENISDSKERSIFKSAAHSLEEGDSLRTALEKSGSFPEHMLQMLELGEHSGKLEEVFFALSDYYDRQTHLKRSIRTAVINPLVMLFVMLAILAVLFIKILPVFSQVFRQVGAQLPILLQTIADSSEISAVICFVLLAVLLALAGVIFFAQKNRKSRQLLSRVIVNFPVTRKAAEISASSTFAYSMSLLLSSGIPPDEAVAFLLETDSNPELNQLKQRMDQGETFSQALKNSHVLPAKYAALMAVGEKTGSMDEMMDLTAKRCMEDTDQRIGRILSYTEPVIAIIMCLLIGSVLMSVMFPLIKIMTAM